MNRSSQSEAELNSFTALVRSIVDPVLSEAALKPLSNFVSADGTLQVSAYEAEFHRVALYRSLRDGEVNCLVGNQYADFSNLSSIGGWTYLRSLTAPGGAATVDELLRRVPAAPISSAMQLKELVQEFTLYVSGVTPPKGADA